MAVCKYFQRGTCHYGQYCRFQHINTFGAPPGGGSKPFVEGKSIVLGVAEEVLAAERGGQWLLSCFGPLKEQSCIPGMEDVSPEEVRWEMYQAQKNGTVDQTKMQFQQLCQAMTAKREALKNPTHETAAMLEKLQKSNRDSAFGNKTNFSLSTRQMAQTGSSTSSTNVFGAKTFGGTTNNPFGGGFNATSGTSSSIFGAPATSNTSVFGAKPSFGGNAVFGGQTTGNSVFGGGTASKSGSTVFGGNQSGMQTFATTGTPNNSVFGGGTGQTVFAQPTTFGSTSQANSSPFGSQPSQLTTASSGPFGAGTSGLFGGTTAISTTIGSTSIFAQPKSTAAFGGAPVFGASGFGNPQGGSIFGGSANFENAPASVFGASTQPTTFGSNVQTTSSFGALAAPNSPFGAAISTANSTPFGAAVSTTNSTPFGAQSAPFVTGNSPFARNPSFGGTMQTPSEVGFVGGGESSPFAPSAFGTIPPPVSQPFGTPAFGSAPSTPFASTTSTATTSNPFAPRSQQINTPFGIAQTTMSGGPFGQTNYGSITTAAIIDETAYTIEGKLTDDEKSLYLSDKFVLGKIPLKPPTIELR